MINLIMRTVCRDQFCNPYGSISFGIGVRTKHAFEPMEMVGSNKIAPLFGVTTQTVTIIKIIM